VEIQDEHVEPLDLDDTPNLVVRLGSSFRPVIGTLVVLAETIPRNILFAANLRYYTSVPRAVPLIALGVDSAGGVNRIRRGCCLDRLEAIDNRPI
jgi:hypothetical protein